MFHGFKKKHCALSSLSTCHSGDGLTTRLASASASALAVLVARSSDLSASSRSSMVTLASCQATLHNQEGHVLQKSYLGSELASHNLMNNLAMFHVQAAQKVQHRSVPSISGSVSGSTLLKSQRILSALNGDSGLLSSHTPHMGTAFHQAISRDWPFLAEMLKFAGHQQARYAELMSYPVRGFLGAQVLGALLQLACHMLLVCGRLLQLSPLAAAHQIIMFHQFGQAFPAWSSGRSHHMRPSQLRAMSRRLDTNKQASWHSSGRTMLCVLFICISHFRASCACSKVRLSLGMLWYLGGTSKDQNAGPHSEGSTTESLARGIPNASQLVSWILSSLPQYCALDGPQLKGSKCQASPGGVPNALELGLKLVPEVLSSLQLLQRLRLLPLQLLLLLSQSGCMGRLMIQLAPMVFLGPGQLVLLSFDALLPSQQLFIQILHEGAILSPSPRLSARLWLQTL